MVMDMDMICLAVILFIQLQHIYNPACKRFEINCSVLSLKKGTHEKILQLIILGLSDTQRLGFFEIIGPFLLRSGR